MIARTAPPDDATSRTGSPARPVPWARIVWGCLASTTLAVALVALAAVRDGGIEQVLFAGELGPGADVLRRDFPDIDLLEDDPGHDGQHFYVLARALPHLSEAKDDLGFRPGYRAQRIALPLLTRVLHPQGGGGDGLVTALLVANGLGILAGAIGVSVLVTARGGPVWVGLLFPWLPACLQGLQLTLADAFGAGLAVAALAAASRRRPLMAFALALAALLGKESTLIVFAGWGLWALLQRLDWRVWAPFVAAPAVAGAWFLSLRETFPGPRLQGEEFVAPLTGLVDAVRATFDGATGASWFGLSVSVLVFVGLLVVAGWGDRSLPWPWIAALLAAYQTLLTDAFWYKTINALRFTVSGMAILLVVVGTRLPSVTRLRAALASAP